MEAHLSVKGPAVAAHDTRRDAPLTDAAWREEHWEKKLDQGQRDQQIGYPPKGSRRCRPAAREFPFELEFFVAPSCGRLHSAECVSYDSSGDQCHWRNEKSGDLGLHDVFWGRNCRRDIEPNCARGWDSRAGWTVLGRFVRLRRESRQPYQTRLQHNLERPFQVDQDRYLQRPC